MMAKKDGLSNRNKILIVIAVIIILILFFLLRRLFWSSVSDEIDYTPDISEQDYSDYYSPSQSSREFKKSDKLTTISFSRTANFEDDYDADSEDYWSTEIELSFVLSGYLEEVSVAGYEPMDTARNYILNEDKIEWSVYAKEIDGDPECVYTYVISGSGSDDSSNLEDESVMEGWREIKFVYGDYGSETGTPEISIGGVFLIPVKETDNIEVYDPSPNVHAICDGYTEATTLTKDDIVKLRFPLILSNVNINDTLLSGSGRLKEQDWEAEQTGNAMLDDTHVVATIPYTISTEENVYWDVEWEINLP